MDFPQIIQQILLFVTGAGLSTMVNFLISKKKEDREDFAAIIQLWKDDNNRLRVMEESLKDRIAALEDTINDLKFKLLLLETSHMELPIPMWIKDKKGVMLYVNKEYEKLFLHPMGKTASDYVGKMDSDIWPADVAAKFKFNDLRAHGNTVYTFEELPIKDKVYNLFVIKYPRKTGGEVIGVAGIAFDKTLLT